MYLGFDGRSHIFSGDASLLQVFMPGERLENSLALHLVFCQVVQDVYNNGCIRINKEDRIKMRGMLGAFKVPYFVNYPLIIFKKEGFCVSLYYKKDIIQILFWY